ncbi:LysM domain-containing protein [Alkalihalobacillus sp. TS-13]|uniref:LysM peptidoglycan-binding domain-containing protein n=1 Tax=Alkalihalobacillus sp. TS-13 TaxID=2842455 RepID=UPI001C8797F8
MSQRYGTTVQELLIANQLADPSVLYIGQVLVLPVISHPVQPGETFWRIATRYKTTIDAIVQAKQLQTPVLIYPG